MGLASWIRIPPPTAALQRYDDVALEGRLELLRYDEVVKDLG